MIDQDYLTINEAAKFTGQSPTTIRRRIKEIVDGKTDSAGADRFHILPTKEQKEAGIKKPWTINKALLFQLYPHTQNQEATPGNEPPKNSLDRMLDIMDKDHETLRNTITDQKKEIQELKDDNTEKDHIIDQYKTKLLKAGENVEVEPKPKADDSTTETDDVKQTKEVAEQAKQKVARSWIKRAAARFANS